mgnify:CR=1 FL=1
MHSHKKRVVVGLSGGVDSSIVSFGLSKLSNQKIDTFSIGFDKASFDETDKSRVVAKLINSNHHEFIISEKDLTENIDDIILNFDEPFADSSQIPTFLVSQLARQQVTVALSGDGGDELFGGYNRYVIANQLWGKLSLLPKPQLLLPVPLSLLLVLPFHPPLPLFP